MDKLKFKGTPGPWEVADIDDGWKDCVSARAARGDVIAVSHNEDRTTAEANARLIAASPELLDALHGMIKVWEALSVTMPILLKEPLYDNAKCAIKKALEE